MKPNAAESPTIVVVDDDRAQRSLFESFLQRHGCHVVTAESGEQALQLLTSVQPALLISDVRMPGMSGLEMLALVRKQLPHLPILLITAHADIRDAVGAIQHGAIDYLEKPIDLDDLLNHVQRVLPLPQARGLYEPSVPPLPPGVVAESPGMKMVFNDCFLVASTDTRVLITGESGVGKEVVAQTIHHWSPRRAANFVQLNCAAIPEQLLESELFGHEKGAFTGATASRVGRFEAADGGTIFLDEIGEMPPLLQAKLLHILQNSTFTRVGSNVVHKSTARVLAATNRNLEKEVEAGRFREDLYYRLNVLEIYVPPLRERREDILPLCQSFAAHFSSGRPRFSPQALECLQRYNWPGNVRELRNALERAVLLSRGNVILPEHLPKRVQEPLVPVDTFTPATVSPTMEDIERSAILTTLASHDYNRTETAKALGMSRRALTYKLATYRSLGHQIDVG